MMSCIFVAGGFWRPTKTVFAQEKLVDQTKRQMLQQLQVLGVPPRMHRHVHVLLWLSMVDY
jgi:hypothetical protein